MDESSISLNGIWPDLEGKVLEKLVCIELIYDGEVHERANVIYLQFESKWFRLYFDCGIIFWRESTDSPFDWDAPELDCSYRVVPVGSNLDLNGQTVSSLNAKSFDSGSEVNFVFENDKKITFYDYNDIANYRT